MFWRRREPSDFKAEIQAHLDLETDDLTDEGVNRSEARQRAHREFGNVVAVEERFYESRPGVWLEQFWQDLRYGVRTMRLSPAFTFIAVLSLALGIGANTAVFSVLDAVMLKNLPVRAPEELRILQWPRSRNEPLESHSGYNMKDSVTGQQVSGSFSYAIYRSLRANVSQFSDVIAYAPNQFTVSAAGTSEFASGQFVSGNYFTGLGVQTLLGRPILDDDDAPGKAGVVVLTYRYWEKRFGLDATIVGRDIAVNQKPYTVVGVLRPAFQGLYPGSVLDIFVPIARNAEIGSPWYSMTAPDIWWVQLFARLRPGVSDDAAAAAVRAIMTHEIETYSKNAAIPAVMIRPGG